jgi:hypothetical protein
MHFSCQLITFILFKWLPLHLKIELHSIFHHIKWGSSNITKCFITEQKTLTGFIMIIAFLNSYFWRCEKEFSNIEFYLYFFPNWKIVDKKRDKTEHSALALCSSYSTILFSTFVHVAKRPFINWETGKKQNKATYFIKKYLW